MSKNTILTGGICFLLVFLLLHPAESLSCARAGMTLWLNTLIPTLLPFIILTGMLTHTGHIRKFLLPFESFFRIFPGVSIWGGYVFILGMLCGYPLGAKLASDLYESQKISKKEALYLTTFCNNPSPAFIITYLGKSCLKDAVPVGMIFTGIFLSNLICMLFFRYPVYKNTIILALPPMHKNTSHGTIHIQSIPDPPNSTAQISSQENVLDHSIMNGFETITRLGGYILLFSVLAGCIRYYEPFPPFFQYLVLGFQRSPLVFPSSHLQDYQTRHASFCPLQLPHPEVCVFWHRQEVFFIMISAFCLILFPNVSVPSLRQVFFTV